MRVMPKNRPFRSSNWMREPKPLENSQSAQKMAAVAIVGVVQLASGVDEVISGLDQYEVAKGIAVKFAAGSTVLSPEAKAALNEIVQEARDKDGYVIEIEGFASSDGGADYNRRLSQRRADGRRDRSLSLFLYALNCDLCLK